MIAQMNSDPKSLITYAGKKAEPSEKLIEAVDKTFGECEVAVKEHIVALRVLADDLTGAATIRVTPADDTIKSLTAVKTTGGKLELLDRTATAMDDIAKFLPKSVTPAEKNYIKSLVKFMTIIADDLQFNNEAVEKLVKEINDNKADYNAGNIRPYPAPLSTLFDELTEMRQVVEAIDASITEFDDYSTRDAEAPTKYPNFSKSAITGFGDQLSYLKMELLDTYTIALQALATQCGLKPM